MSSRSPWTRNSTCRDPTRASSSPRSAYAATGTSATILDGIGNATKNSSTTAAVAAPPPGKILAQKNGGGGAGADAGAGAGDGNPSPTTILSLSQIVSPVGHSRLQRFLSAGDSDEDWHDADADGRGWNFQLAFPEPVEIYEPLADGGTSTTTTTTTTKSDSNLNSNSKSSSNNAKAKARNNYSRPNINANSNANAKADRESRKTSQHSSAPAAENSAHCPGGGKQAAPTNAVNVSTTSQTRCAASATSATTTTPEARRHIANDRRSKKGRARSKRV